MTRDRHLSETRYFELLREIKRVGGVPCEEYPDYMFPEDEPDPEALMQSVSPRVIPRNHRIEEMISAAVKGDFAPFERLTKAYAQPYSTEDTELMRPPTEDERVPATFCGT